MNQTARQSTIGTSSQTHAAAAAPATGRRRRLGRVVAATVVTGLVTGVLLVFAPFIPASGAGATGALLCGFALGWALLAVLSVRFTDQPQRWAAVPAAFMGLGGLTLIVFGSSGQHVLSWLWPPALLAVTVWMVVQAPTVQTLGAGARVLLYPVFAFLAVASIGGGIETILETVDAARYPMAGQLVDVDGHGMHLSCTGTGSPTWSSSPVPASCPRPRLDHPGRVPRHPRMRVRPPRTRLERPDRHAPGRHPRRSRPAHPPARSPRARALRARRPLLRRPVRPGIRGPLPPGRRRLGAHRLHLADNARPQTEAPAATSDGLVARGSALVSIAARLGLGRLYSLTAYGSLPTQSRDEVRATISTATTLRSTIDEFAQASTSMQEAAELRDFEAKPLVVLTAGDGSDAAWFARQDRLAQVSTNTSHRVVAGASHEMLVGDRTASSSTITAIRDVVASVRSRAPLTR